MEGGAKQRRHLIGEHRPGEKVTLAAIAPDLGDDPPLQIRFDSFGRHNQTKIVGEHGHRFEDREAAPVGAQSGDERAINLHYIDWKLVDSTK